MLGTFPKAPAHAAQCSRDDQAAQHGGEVLPARRFKPQRLEQVHLAALGVVEHPLVPAVVDGFPHGPQVLHHARAEGAQGVGERTLGRAQTLELAHAVRRDGACGVYTHPATPLHPDFGPGMGIGVAHRPVAIHGVALAALVARDDACWHIHGAHQHHEGRGNVFAKAFLAVKPELVGGVLAIDAWIEGVVVAPCAQALQDGIHQNFRAGVRQCRVCPHLCRQLQGARIEAGRQLGVHAQLPHRLLGAVAELGVAHGLVAHHLGDGTCRHPLQVLRHVGLHVVGQLGRLGGGLQHHQPGLALGFERHLIAHRRAADLQIGGQGCTCGPGAVFAEGLGLPFPAIERGHDGPTKVQRGLRRHIGGRPLKAQADGHPLIQCDLGHVPDLHRARQAATPGEVFAGHAPQR
ncbi:hypothetical protein D3C71_1266520 [compost metagenome]